MTKEDRDKLKAWLLWYQKDAERIARADVPTDRQYLSYGRAEAFREVIAMLPRFERMKVMRPYRHRGSAS